LSVKFGIMVAGNGRSALIPPNCSKNLSTIRSHSKRTPTATPGVLEQQYGVQVTADNRVVALETSVILLAVKPQLFEVIAAECRCCSYTSSRITTAGDFNLSRCAVEQAGSGFSSTARHPGNALSPATVGAGITAIPQVLIPGKPPKHSAETVLCGGEVVKYQKR